MTPIWFEHVNTSICYTFSCETGLERAIALKSKAKPKPLHDISFLYFNCQTVKKNNTSVFHRIFGGIIHLFFIHLTIHSTIQFDSLCQKKRQICIISMTLFVKEISELMWVFCSTICSSKLNGFWLQLRSNVATQENMSVESMVSSDFLQLNECMSKKLICLPWRSFSTSRTLCR